MAPLVATEYPPARTASLLLSFAVISTSPPLISELFPTVDLVSALETRTDTAPAIAASAVPVSPHPDKLAVLRLLSH